MGLMLSISSNLLLFHRNRFALNEGSLLEFKNSWTEVDTRFSNLYGVLFSAGRSNVVAPGSSADFDDFIGKFPKF